MESSTPSMTCRACGAVSPSPAAFCSLCGQSLGATTAAPRPDQPKPRWHQNVWFVLFMLFFVIGPFGLPLVWKNPRFPRWVKVALTLAMVVYTVALIDVTVRAFRAVMQEMQALQSTF